MKTILVLDDSSRVGFGGGQKMTLMVCDVLKDFFKFRFVDFSDKTRYHERVREQFPDSGFLSIGQNDGYKGRKSIWTSSIFKLLFQGKRDAKRIVKGLDVKECVAYATGKRFLLFAYLLNKIYGIPYIYHAHLVENPHGLYYPIFKQITKKVCAILCVSKTVMDSIVSDNKQLLYNPSLNDKGPKDISTKKPFVVAFIGSLIPIKGVEYFIDAAKICDNEIEFRVYGDGPLRNELEERANGRVRFMGFVNDIIQEEYDSIDLIVVPTILKEALPLVAVDAKSVGIPLVVTSPGGQAEIVKDGIEGFHVPMMDSKAIADKVTLLAQDGVLYKSMAEASFNSFDKFNFKVFSQKVREVFSDLK